MEPEQEGVAGQAVKYNVGEVPLQRHLAKRYLRSILKLRRMQRAKAANVLQGVALLDLVLKLGEKYVSVKVRTSDLYVVGYQVNDGIVWEMRHEDDDAILFGSRALGIGVSYGKTSHLKLGYISICQAVQNLIDITDPDTKSKSQTVVSSLFTIIIIIMMIEGARFFWISDTLMGRMRSRSQDCLVDDFMSDIWTDWKKMTKMAHKLRNKRITLYADEWLFVLDRDTTELFRSRRLCSHCLRVPCLLNDGDLSAADLDDEEGQQQEV